MKKWPFSRQLPFNMAILTIGAVIGAIIGAIIGATRVVRYVRLIFHLFCLLNNNFLLFPISELFITIPIIGATR